MKNSVRFCLLSLFAIVTVSLSNAQNNYTLNPLTSFGSRGDGSIQPGDSIGVLTLDSAFNQRGLACDPITTNLVWVDTHSGSGGSSYVTGNVYVVDGLLGTPATPSTLLTNGINGGSYADTGAAIADDGVVFVCNQTPVSTNIIFKIYRWQ